MPVEFLHETGDNSKDYKLLMAYDGSGRRISKTRYAKDDQFGYWYLDHVTHYTGIGTEVREAMRRSASPEVKVVVNLPQGLGRYGVEDAEKPSSGNATFEWYLKNHLGSTMLVYGTQGSSNADVADLGEVKKAYDYRSFGEQIDLIADAGDKVTENFTGKEKDDETELNYFGARYLDPMLGLWISVDPKRQFASPYLYVGNGMNPVNGVDPDGNSVSKTAVKAAKGYGTVAGFAGIVNTAKCFAELSPNGEAAQRIQKNTEDRLDYYEQGGMDEDGNPLEPPQGGNSAYNEYGKKLVECIAQGWDTFISFLNPSRGLSAIKDALLTDPGDVLETGNLAVEKGDQILENFTTDNNE